MARSRSAKPERAERVIFYTLVTVISLLAIIALLFIFTTSYQPVGRLYEPAGIFIEQLEGCSVPRNTADLLRWSSARQNVPLSGQSCFLLAQDYCITENSGRCTQQCLNLQRSPQGVCKGRNFPITGDVILNFEECRRLTESFAHTAKDALQLVGASPQQEQLYNPCAGTTEDARSRIYSLTQPLQAYSRNEFPSGDIHGLYANEQKNVDALEYTLCADGRARVVMSGEERCSTI